MFLGYDWLVKSGREECSRLELHADMNERDVLASTMIGQTIVAAGLGVTGLEIEISGEAWCQPSTVKIKGAVQLIREWRQNNAPCGLVRRAKLSPTKDRMPSATGSSCLTR